MRFIGSCGKVIVFRVWVRVIVMVSCAVTVGVSVMDWVRVMVIVRDSVYLEGSGRKSTAKSNADFIQ